MSKKLSKSKKISITALVKKQAEEPILISMPTPIDDESIDSANLCDICVTNKYDYVCVGCKCKMCNNCLEKYIIDYANLSPHCMNCQSLLPFIVIYNALGKDGFNTYLNKASELKFQIELQKAPDCMECCNTLIKYSKLNNIHKQLLRTLYRATLCNTDEISPDDEDITTNYQAVNTSIDDILFEARLQILDELRLAIHYPLEPNHHYTTEEENILSLVCQRMHDLSSISKFRESYAERLNEAFKPFTDLKPREITLIGNNIDMLSSKSDIIGHFAFVDEHKDLGRAKKVDYLFRCSYKDCKGLVNDKFECELCRHHYCSKCFKLFENSEDEKKHQCDESDLLTAKDLIENTKPCPKCAARIFKISGCSQMFCTNCHVGFDWNTGKLIHNNFHNPHRLAWLQQNNLTDNDLDCDMFNGPGSLKGLLIRSKLDVVFEFMRREYEMNHYRIKIQEYQQKINKIDKDDFKNRCLYLINDLSKEDYIKYLKHNVRTHHRLDMIYNIYNSYVEIITTIIQSAAEKSIRFMNSFNNYDYEFVSILGFLWKSILNYNNTTQLKSFIDESNNLSSTDKLIQSLEGSLNENKTKWWKKQSTIDFNDDCCSMIIDILKAMPTFEDDITLMDKLSIETRNDIKTYKSIFGLSKITMPVTSIESKKTLENQGYVNYYIVE